MTVDISDWQSEDWDSLIRNMEAWIESNVGNVDGVWPKRQELLHFNRINDAIEFILRWA